MKIIKELPPIYEDILAAGMLPTHGAIYAYGDTIYNPSGGFISDHTIAHEETHCRQQGDDPNAWWGRYLDDQYFRINQEAEAYAYQFKFLCQTVKDRNQRDRILQDMARVLSSPTYGSVIGHMNAYITIKNKVKTI